MTRNKLISFCYLYIVGIGFAMAFTAGPEALPTLWGATALLGLLTLVGFLVGGGGEFLSLGAAINGLKGKWYQ